MKLLLLFNKKHREENIATLIKNAVAGYETIAEVMDIYWGEEENNIVDIIQFDPDVVITFPLTIPDLIEEISVIKSMCKSIICTLTTEGFMTPEDVKHVVGYYCYPPELVDYYLFFGSKYAQIYCECLKKKGILKEDGRVIVVGYPMWEWSKLEKLEKYRGIDNKIADRKQNYKKTILVLSGFAEANKSIKQIKVCNDSYDANAANKKEQIQRVFDFVKENQEYRKKYYNMIETLARKMPDIVFLLKLHPVEIEHYINGKGYDFSHLEDYKNIEIIKDNIPTCFYLKHADVLIHYGSTVSAEAYLRNVPSICVEGLYDDVFKSDVSVKNFNVDVVENLIKTNFCVKLEQNRDQFCYDFFDYQKDCKYSPSERIAQFVLEMNFSLEREKCGFKYIDNGYYKKMQMGYILMGIKQFAEMHVGRGKKFFFYALGIRRIRRKLTKGY